MTRWDLWRMTTFPENVVIFWNPCEITLQTHLSQSIAQTIVWICIAPYADRTPHSSVCLQANICIAAERSQIVMLSSLYAEPVSAY